MKKTLYFFIFFLMASYVYADENNVPVRETFLLDNIGKTRAELLEIEGPYERAAWLEDAEVAYEEISFGPRRLLGFLYKPVYAVENGVVVGVSFFIADQPLWQEAKKHIEHLEEYLELQLIEPLEIKTITSSPAKWTYRGLFAGEKFYVFVMAGSRKSEFTFILTINVSNRQATGAFAQRENANYDNILKTGSLE